MTAPKRRDPWDRQPDPWLATVERYTKRGWELPCDCPCHGWAGVSEAARCCEMAGMRYVAAERAYVPWPEWENSTERKRP